MAQPLKDSTILALCKEISSQVCKDLEDEGERQSSKRETLAAESSRDMLPLPTA